MPILERAVSLIEESAPMVATNVQNVLERNQLSRYGMKFEAFTKAMKAFQVEWNLACRPIGKEPYLLPLDRANTMETLWTFMDKEADRRDFVPLDTIKNAKQVAADFAPEIVALGVSKVPTLDWLDGSHLVYWSLGRAGRGWNKIINVCRKILTVTPEVPFGRLMKAVKRARTITDYPSSETLMSMLCAIDDVNVQEGMVSRGRGFKPDDLSKTDRLMISVAKDVGTVATFLELREALVQKDVSGGHAEMLVSVTPLWVTMSRGKYRFIANKDQLQEFSLMVPTKDYGDLEMHECLVELEVAHRHLVMGTHRIDENFVMPGHWSLKDQAGNQLGKIEVTANMVKGLNGVFAVAGIEAGTFVKIDFSSQKFIATVIH